MDTNGQYLTFFIGEEEYALSIVRIREILEFSGATRVPGTPPSIVGVINLRGRVVPVIDLARKFGSAPAAVTARSCVVIVDMEVADERFVVGLLADAVHEVADIEASHIEPPPPFGTRARVDYLQGLARHADRFLLVLDIDRVVSATESEAIGAVSAEAVMAGAG